MSWPYAYTPYIWPMLGSALLLAALGVSASRRPRVPATIPFVAAMLSTALWALGSALELAAVEPGAKFLWFQFQGVLKAPVAILVLVFVLVFAGLDKWLTRVSIALLALACILSGALIITNPMHHLMWPTVSVDGGVQATFGPAFWAMALLTYLLFFLQTGVLVWLILRSPLYRWPCILILGQQLVTRGAFITDALGVNPVAPLDPVILLSVLGCVVYFLALFHFRIFDVVPIGRDMAMERMADGVLILDVANRIVDLNPAALEVLAIPRRAAIGRPAVETLAAYPELVKLLTSQTAAVLEIGLKGAREARYFQVHLSALTHSRGFKLGRLILLQDMTEQKRAQEQLQAQRQLLAVLQERERLAQELHDSLSQELAFINVQAQAAHELLAGGSSPRADEYVVRLASVARQAQVDARDLMSGLMSSFSEAEGFGPSLRRFLDRFCHTYGIETELSAPDEQILTGLPPVVQVQLQRIIQEALTNIRKHAQARHVALQLRAVPGRVEVVIEDDGVGFDLAERQNESGHYGLRIMRERAAAVGGRVEIHSEPGRGTRLVVSVPVNGEQ